MAADKAPDEITVPGHDNPDDPRPDIQQAVEARADAVARGEGGGEGGEEPDGEGGESGAGGRVKNQDEDAQ